MGAINELLKAASLNDPHCVFRMRSVKLQTVVPTHVDDTDLATECDGIRLGTGLLLNKPKESGNFSCRIRMDEHVASETNEARAIHKKSTRLRWSGKLRCNSRQLFAGLDIPATPTFDALNTKRGNLALDAGPQNEWSEHSCKETTYAPWFSDSGKSSPVNAITHIDTLQEAYNVISQYVHSLRDESSDRKLRIAVKQLHNTSVCDKALLVLQRVSQTRSRSTPAVRAMNSTELLMSQINGTWELVTAFRDTISGAVKHYEPGYHRRCIDLLNGTCTDNKRDLWGLLEANLQYTLSSNIPDMRLYLTNSVGMQIVQVQWCNVMLPYK